METFCTFFWGTLGIVAGLAAPGLVMTIVVGFFAAIASVVKKND